MFIDTEEVMQYSKAKFVSLHKLGNGFVEVNLITVLSYSHLWCAYITNTSPLSLAVPLPEGVPQFDISQWADEILLYSP